MSDTAMSALANVSRLGTDIGPPRGPFDEPPSEPVVLEGDIPWELRDAE
jgi:hypothetical protein